MFGPRSNVAQAAASDKRGVRDIHTGTNPPRKTGTLLVEQTPGDEGPLLAERRPYNHRAAAASAGSVAGVREAINVQAA